MQAGDLVRVLPPFSGAFPDEYAVLSVSGDTCRLENGVDFESTYLVKVGAVPVQAGPRQAITKLAFLRRFPAAKRIALRAAAQTDPILADALALLDAAQDVRTDDPDTVAMVGYCVMQGLLSAEDQTNILA